MALLLFQNRVVKLNEQGDPQKGGSNPIEGRERLLEE